MIFLRRDASCMQVSEIAKKSYFIDHAIIEILANEP